MKKYDVIIIGGGASGMMAAIFAAKNGADVLLIEKNKRLGEKVRISGGGRCNITNAEFDTRVLLTNYGKAEKFLHSAFAKFGIQDTIDFFIDVDLGIKVEAKKRAFPISNDANDVIRVLEKEMKKLNAEVLRCTRVTKINHKDGNITSLNCGRDVYEARQYILASGGMSRPETGSTGDGFDWLADLGHSVNNPTPSITPLALKEKWVELVAGVSAKDVRVTFMNNGKKAFRVDGDILFTHFGVSGPMILSNAYKVSELLQGGEVTALIDCFPALDTRQLDQKIVQILNVNGSKQLKNVLSYFVPQGLSPIIKELLHKSVDLDIKTSEVSKISRGLIVGLLKGIPITIDRLMGMEKAVVADGGVDLREVDTRTFRSLKIANLFVTGDLLDINRPSGGFSLQLCWTTGFIAGTEAAYTTIDKE